jgi:hypothetical protein
VLKKGNFRRENNSKSSMDISSLFEDFTVADLQAIMVGVSVDLNKVEDVETFRDAAVHCCLNGPVGTGKLTTFPGSDEKVRLKDLYTGRLSNKMWRNFCRVVGEHLIHNYPAEVESCQQRQLYAQIWPQHEDLE